jgi:hypothetical protein
LIKQKSSSVLATAGTARPLSGARNTSNMVDPTVVTAVAVAMLLLKL